MLVTLVVRLVPEGLASGKFVGRVEDVGSGESEVVHGVSDLVGFAQRAAADQERGPNGASRAMGIEGQEAERT